MKPCLQHTHTHPTYCPKLDFFRDYPGEPVPEPIWILLKQETVTGIGISWAISKFAPRPTQPCQHPTTPFFYRLDAHPAIQPTVSKHRRQTMPTTQLKYHFSQQNTYANVNWTFT